MTTLNLIFFGSNTILKHKVFNQVETFVSAYQLQTGMMHHSIVKLVKPSDEYKPILEYLND